MTRADIRGQVVSQSTHPCRHLMKHYYDGQRKVMGFDIPSQSRKKSGRVYAVELHVMSGQIACGCEAFSRGEDGFREAHNMPYRKEAVGAFLEQVCPGIHPLIIRKPSGLCPHAKKVRAYLKRHKTPDGKTLYDHIAAIVKAWEDDYLRQQQERKTA